MRKAIVIALLLGSAPRVGAQFVFQPPESTEPWVGTRVLLTRTAGRTARWGMAVLASNARGTLHRLYLRAYLTDPSAVCSVWLAKHNDQGRRLAQVRVDDTYPPLRADLEGGLFLVHNLDRNPIGAYDAILVRYHPSADPRDTGPAVEVLRGEIPEGKP